MSVQSRITKNQDEFARLKNDIECLRLMSGSYGAKVGAAEIVLRYGYTNNVTLMETAARMLDVSLQLFGILEIQTRKSYYFANSMQTGHRKIPFPGAANGVGTNYHWTQVLPLYQKELDDFRTNVAKLKTGQPVTLFETNAPITGSKIDPEIAEPTP